MSGQCHVPAITYPGKDPVPIVQEAGWAPGRLNMTRVKHSCFESIYSFSKKLYILYYPIIMACLPAELIHFPHSTSRKMLWMVT